MNIIKMIIIIEQKFIYNVKIKVYEKISKNIEKDLFYTYDK